MEVEQYLLEGEFDVGSGEWVAIVPPYTLAEMKPIACAVLFHLPAAGECRQWPQGVIEAEQTVVEQARGGVNAAVGRNGRVQMPWVADCGDQHRVRVRTRFERAGSAEGEGESSRKRGRGHTPANGKPMWDMRE